MCVCAHPARPRFHEQIKNREIVGGLFNTVLLTDMLLKHVLCLWTKQSKTCKEQ